MAWRSVTELRRPIFQMLMTRLGSVVRRLAPLASLVVLASIATPSDASSQTDRTKKVLVIGIDGVRADVLGEVDAPNIDRLVAEGAFSADGRTTIPSVSGPAWSSMLIGVSPDKHGVFNNQFHENQYETYPDFLTRAEGLRPELETFVAADWLPLVTDDSGGPLISGDAIDEMIVHDGYEVGWGEGDQLGVDAAIAALATSNPDAMFVYLGNPDETSHQAGSIGIEYRQAIELADRHVGQLIDAIQKRDTIEAEDWLVLISTDHGRRLDGGHGGRSAEEMTIFIVAHGPSVAAGTTMVSPRIEDVAVTALAHLGITIDPSWGLDGTALKLAP